MPPKGPRAAAAAGQRYRPAVCRHGERNVHFARVAASPRKVSADFGEGNVMLDMSSQSRRHPLAERGRDLYETPSVGTEALLRVEQIPHRVWESAAGRGAITRVLQDHGHDVISSDICDYGFPLDFVGDFLMQEQMPAGCSCILTNPPYQIVEPFVARALKLAPLVIMLLRLAFLESERRCSILEGRGLACVHVFTKRLPMMHRDQWAGRKANSGMAFAWMIWKRGYASPTVIDRISWKR
jgi:hypothetical protein